MKINKKTVTNMILFLSLVILIPSVLANNPGEQNASVQTQVNVTNAPPYITSLTLPTSVDLVPGLTKEVNCTVEVSDWNGWQTIKNVNATLWDNNTVLVNDSDINITHYTNTNCTKVADSGAYNATYQCSFQVQYFAYNSTNWACNATALDNSTWNFTDWEVNTTTINPLYALNVTPVINFGEAAVGETITNRTANVTNFGNQAINISVQGYGSSIGDGLALNCTTNGYISIGNLYFSSSASPIKTAMDGGIQNMTNITIPKIDQVSVNPGTWNQTYWDLFIDPANDPFGWCTGTVIFTAWNS